MAARGQSWTKSVRQFTTDSWRDGQLQARYIWRDAMRHPRNFVVAVTTVVVVVAFLSLLLSSIQQSAIVFVKLSENQVGEYDLLLTPRTDLFSGDSINLPDFNIGNITDLIDVNGTAFNANFSSINATFPSFFLNQTWIQESLASVDQVRGTAPRWTVLGRVFNRDDSSLNTSLIVLVIDTDLEHEIGLGRDWGYRALGEDECYVSSSVLRALNVRPNAGDRLILGFDFLTVLDGVGLANDFRDVIVDIIANGIRNQTLTLNSSQIDINALLESLGFTPPFNFSIPNQNATINFNAGEVLTDAAINAIANQIYDLISPLLQQQLDASALQVELTVVDGVEDPKGKWPTALGNVLVLEKKWVPTLLAELLPTNDLLTESILDTFNVTTAEDATQTLSDRIKSLPMEQYALLVAVQNNDRLKSYVKDNNGLKSDMIKFTNLVAESLGINYPATFTLPLVTALTGVYYIRLFLDQIFVSVLAILVLLAIMLIYSLLLSDVEEKTYEYGMLRALGLRHRSLIQMLMMQALSFSLPGIAIGLVIAFLLFWPVSRILSDQSSTNVRPVLTADALILGCVLGLVLPVISNIAPIQRALSRTLRDSLDVYHQVFSETTVQMVKLENLGLDLWQIALAIVLVLIGFVVYYLIPLAFTFNNLPLFFGILNGILLGMVLGAAAVASTIQPVLEKIMLWLILWGPDTNMHALIRKSLAGHRRRNRKTALMFTISLCFIIFSGAMFSLQARSLSDNIKAGIGSDIQVFAFTTDKALDETNMRNFLNLNSRSTNSSGTVESFTFVTFPMDLTETVSSSRISNLATFPVFSFSLVGVEPNYLDTVFTDYYRANSIDESFTYAKSLTTPSVKDTIRSLYTNAGQALLSFEKNGIVVPPDVTSNPLTDGQPYDNYRSANDTYVKYIDIIVSEALKDGAAITIDVPIRLRIGVRIRKFVSTSLIYLAKARAQLSKLPGFFFSSYKQTAAFTTGIVSMDDWQQIFVDSFNIRKLALAEDSELSNETAPSVPIKQSLQVRLKSGATKENREDIINGLRNFIPDSTVLVFDTSQLLTATDVAVDMLVLFFNIANVRENAWEFGVLRAVGLSGAQVIRAYIYEALAIIIAAVLTGALIGMLIAITLTLQFNLFTEMPFVFTFPTSLFFSVLAMSVAVAVLGSYLPARNLRAKPISNVLKGGT